MPNSARQHCLPIRRRDQPAHPRQRRPHPPRQGLGPGLTARAAAALDRDPGHAQTGIGKNDHVVDQSGLTYEVFRVKGNYGRQLLAGWLSWASHSRTPEFVALARSIRRGDDAAVAMLTGADVVAFLLRECERVSVGAAKGPRRRAALGAEISVSAGPLRHNR